MNKYVTVCGKRYPTIEANDPAWDSITSLLDPKCAVDSAFLSGVITDLQRSNIAIAFVRHPRTTERPPLVELCRPRPNTYKPKRSKNVI